MVRVVTDPGDGSDGGYDYGTGTVAPPVSTGSLAIRLASGLKVIADTQVRDNANVLRPVQEAVVRTATGLKRFFGRLAAVPSKTAVTGSRNSTGTIAVTTASVTVTPFGGTSPYTYAWTRTDGGVHSWIITTPTAQSTTFSTLVASHSTEAATFRMTVTDKLGVTATADINATALNGSQ